MPVALGRGGEIDLESDLVCDLALLAEGEEGRLVPHGRVSKPLAAARAAVRPYGVVSEGAVEQLAVEL